MKTKINDSFHNNCELDISTLENINEELNSRKTKKEYKLFCQCISEFFGTFILICFGNGVVAQTIISDGNFGSYLGINFAWGFAVFFGIIFSGGISGAHLNPAVTLSFAMYKKFPWNNVIPYIVSQIIGAFFGASIVYLNNFSYFMNVSEFSVSIARIFVTFPQEEISTLNAVVTEMIASALLLAGIFSIIDNKNQNHSPGFQAFSISLLVITIGMTFGSNTGYAMNPARDIGPRIFLSLAKWRGSIFSARNYYFWVPIVAPIFGGLIGGGIYKLLMTIETTDKNRLIKSKR